MFSQEAVCSKITESIYIGNCSAAINKTLMKFNQITHILVCGIGLPSNYSNEFTYKHIKVEDTPSFRIIEFFDESSNFIEDAIVSGGSIFVHCAMGISRSVTILAAYLIKNQKMTTNQALSYIRKKHPRANPNKGFKKQLSEYKRKLLENQDQINIKACKCVVF